MLYLYFPVLAILVDKLFNLDMYILKRWLSKIGLIMTFMILIIMSIVDYINDKDLEFIDTNFYPVDATIYIKENLDYQNIRLFNEYNYGSYLLFNDILVFY